MSAPPAAPISAEQMSHVLDVSRALAVTADLDALMHKIAGAVVALLGCERASIFLHDARTDELWTKVALGTAGQIRLPAGAGVVGHAFRHGSAVHVARPYDDPRFNREVDRRTGFLTRNLLATPMSDIDQRPVGVIEGINKIDDGSGGADGSFTPADVSMLQLLADQAGVALQRYHLQQAAVRSMALEREMQLARAVQQAMTPSPEALPAVPGLASAGWTRPASINGGDCYDLWRLPDGRLAVMLADASGHGIAPALVVSQVRTLARTLSETEPDPFRVLQRVNGRMYDDLPGGRFVTTFLGYVSAAGRIDWCSAGHGPVLVRPDPAADPWRELPATVPPLGVLPELPESCGEAVHLGPGGWLVVASDGITESIRHIGDRDTPGRADAASAGELFGTARLIDTLAATDDRSPAPAATIERIRAAMRDWQHGGEPFDDQTVVAVRRA